MAVNRQVKTFAQGGLDVDSDLRHIQGNDFIDATNTSINFLDNNIGVVEFVKGTTELSTQVNLGHGVNKVVGSALDKENNHIYLIIHNSLGFHTIARVDTQTNELTEIINRTRGLQLPIEDTYNDVVFHRGFLIWADGTYPKSIKVSDFIGASPLNPLLDKAYLEAVAYAPNSRPSVAIVDDSTLNENNLLGKTFQFAYRYVYKDGSRSVLSPYSDLKYTPYSSLSEKEINDDFTNIIQKQNKFVISVNGGDYVEDIEVFVRYSNDTLFYHIETIEGAEGVNTFEFTGDSIGTPLSEGEAAKLYESAPITARSVSAIDGDRIIYGDVTLDMNKLNRAVITSSVEYDTKGPASVAGFEQITPDSISTIDQITDFLSGITLSDYDTLEVTAVSFTKYPQLGSNDYPEFISPDELFTDIGTGDATITLTLGNSPTPTSVRSQLRAASTRFDDGGNLGLYNTYTTGGNSYDLYLMNLTFKSTASNIASVPTFKSGATHRFGLVVKDEAGRASSVYTDDSMNIRVPFFSERVLANRKSYAAIKLDISNFTSDLENGTLQVVYAGSDVQRTTFAQVMTAAAPAATDNTRTIVLDSGSFTEFNTYSFTEGDRIRVHGTETTVASTFTEAPIIAAGSDANTYIVPADFSVAANDIVEIYTPKIEAANDIELFHEIGEPISILSSQLSQTSITLTQGDTYYRGRNFSDANTTLIESFYLSDHYDIQDTTKGRPNANIDTRQRHLSNYLVYSEKYTGVGNNGLFNFGAANYAELNSIYGPINKIIQKRDYINVFQTGKISRLSVNRNIVTQTNGDNIEVSSNQVLSPPNYYLNDIGCDLPNSIVSVDNNIMFVDRFKRRPYRLSLNGLDPIDYGVFTEFRDRLDGDPLDVVGYYDERNKSYIVTFVDSVTSSLDTTLLGTFSEWTAAGSESDVSIGTVFSYNGSHYVAINPSVQTNSYLPTNTTYYAEIDNNKETISGNTLVFNDNIRKWETKLSMVPRNAVYGENVYVTRNGTIHQLGTGNYNEFFGEAAANTTIRVSVSEDPLSVKQINSIHVDSGIIPIDGELQITDRLTGALDVNYDIEDEKYGIYNVVISNPRDVKSTAFGVRLRFAPDGDTDLRLYSVVFNTANSGRTNR